MNFDWGAFSGSIPNLAFAVSQIFLIDIVLAGDNAVVIAMAVRSLPKKKRRFGIIFGAGLAVILRVALTFFAAQLLELNFVKLVGGLLVFWIGCKLLVQDAVTQKTGSPGTSLWNAIWTIMVADVTMSTDNILALAAASRGNLPMLIFGLVLSIPLVVFASDLLSRLMGQYRFIIYFGAAILGKVAAEMIFSDPLLTGLIHLPVFVLYSLEVLFAFGVIVIAKAYTKMGGKSSIGTLP
ncbi:MAG: TerC family protein [Deltaproteobacteria bacterium]|nr:TerC family protein [Deltaproteobacteria bacterium]